MFSSRRFRNLSVTAVVVTLAGLVGSIPIARAAAPTKAQYIAEADAVCQAVDQQAAPLVTAYNNAVKSRDAAGLRKGRKIILQSVVIDQTGLTKVEALPRPAGDVQVLADVWDASGMRLQVTRMLAKAFSPLNADDVGRDERGLQFDEVRYHLLAKSYGFQVCGKKEPKTS